MAKILITDNLTGITTEIENPDIETIPILPQKLTDIVSVTEFGAKGNGIADDTIAFNNALATTASVVTVPKGIYKVTATILVTNKLLQLSHESVITSSLDIDVIELGSKGKLLGGTVQTTNANFTKSCIKLNGKNKISASTYFENVRVENASTSKYNGNGLLLQCRESLDNAYSYIMGVNASNVYISGFDKGIFLDVPASDELPEYTAISFINGNNFINLWFERCKYFMVLNGVNNGSRCVDGNHFVNTHLQYDDNVIAGVVCFGDRNIFNNIQFWDMGNDWGHPLRSNIAIDFKETSSNNIVITPPMYEKYFNITDASNLLNFK